MGAMIHFLALLPTKSRQATERVGFCQHFPLCFRASEVGLCGRLIAEQPRRGQLPCHPWPPIHFSPIAGRSNPSQVLSPRARHEATRRSPSNAFSGSFGLPRRRKINATMERTVDVADDLCLARSSHRTTSTQRGTSSLERRLVQPTPDRPGRSSGSTSTALRAEHEHGTPVDSIETKP